MSRYSVTPNMLIIPVSKSDTRPHSYARLALAPLLTVVTCAAATVAVHGARSGGEAQVPAGRSVGPGGVQRGQGWLRGALLPQPRRLRVHAGEGGIKHGALASGCLAALLAHCALLSVRSTRCPTVRSRPRRHGLDARGRALWSDSRVPRARRPGQRADAAAVLAGRRVLPHVAARRLRRDQAAARVVHG